MKYVDKEHFYNADSGLSNFKIMDFSNDGNDDIIYSGWGSFREERITLLWERAEKNYRLVDYMDGEISAIDIYNKSVPYSFIAYSALCCGAYIGTITHYIPDFTSGRLQYKVSKKIRYYDDMKLPQDLRLIPQRRFRIAPTKYRLRSSPEILDEFDENFSARENYPVYGNILAELVSGVKGLALAEFSDGDKIWWLVLIDQNSEHAYNRFYDDEDAYKCGWMSSRYLETLE